MLENLHRDEATMPIVKRLFGGFRDYISDAQETLMRDGWREAPRVGACARRSATRWRSRLGAP